MSQSSQMDAPPGETVFDGDASDLRLPLSPDEQRVLDLYDTLQKLRLEIAIVNALAAHHPAGTQGPDAVTQKSQEDLLDARAKYKLRNDAVEAVMTANPILKAVHNGTDASPVERDLLPLVERRDEAAMSVAKQASDMGALRSDLTQVQAETARVSRRNVELTAVLCDVAESLKQTRAGSLDSPGARARVARLEDQVRSSRQRWRVIKGVTSGVIAGSGVDWARDDELRDMVLDADDED